MLNSAFRLALLHHFSTVLSCNLMKHGDVLQVRDNINHKMLADRETAKFCPSKSSFL